MEHELRPLWCRAPRQTAKDFRPKYVRHQPGALVAVFLWAALHDRPVSWACRQRRRSTTALRPLRLPAAARRRRIERSFGHATSFGGGPGPLPAWVRTWVWAKLLINAARIRKNKGLRRV